MVSFAFPTLHYQFLTLTKPRGPTLLTAGPWRPVYLETYINRITDLGVDVEVADTLESATVTATIELEGDDSNERTTNVELVDPSGSRVGQSTIKGNDRCQFTVKKPALWYPNGYGEQPLYTVKATIEGGLATVSRRIGLRLSELIQRPIPGKPGLTFFFRVNNIPIYCQGTDWIPPDVFLPRMTPQRYRDWVALAAEGNQNMIRVWGGGVYEDNAFYDSCDELGILIWQDYMMGCGSYPVNDQLLASIKAEAEYNVRRMRHHSCIVLWCGNNEDHWFAESLHLEYNMNDKNPENWLKSNWPARYYYEVLLKDITEKLVPRVPYHFSSPYGGSSSNDPTVGDIHSWRVWMADQPRYPYQDYEKLTGRFVSEFGMKAYPVMRTMKSLISDPEQRHPQSRTLDAWHMADEDQRTIAMYLVDGLRHGNDLEAYIWASQINQAESSDFSLRAFRRLWRGPSREECAGCLIWQLNDCFPAVSWSLADSFMRPKLAYYVTKRDYAPILIGCTRRVDEKAANEFTKVFVDRSTYAEVWASNLTTAPVDMELDILFITISGGNHVHHINQTVTLAANRSVELCRKAFPDENKHDPTGLVVQTRLLDPKDKNKVIARYTEFPQPLRHHDFSMVRVHIKQLAGSSYALSVSGGVAKAVEFSIETDDAQLADACVLSDNCLDLVPGDEQIINVKMVGKIEVPKGGLKVMERHYGQ